MIDQEKELKIIELRAMGWSCDKIAKELGVSKRTVLKYNKKNAESISNRKKLLVEETLEEFHLSKLKRIKLLGMRLNDVSKELDDRDLKTFTTAQLVNLETRYLKLGRELEV